jgi:hypothetical protein
MVCPPYTRLSVQDKPLQDSKKALRSLRTVLCFFLVCRTQQITLKVLSSPEIQPFELGARLLIQSAVKYWKPGKIKKKFNDTVS